MTVLSDAYARKDRNRLEVGWAALEEIESRLAEDKAAGLTSPPRTALSAILSDLAHEYKDYHQSESACRAYLRDSVRLARYFTPDVVVELAQYHLTTAHLLACVIGGEFPDVDEPATKLMVEYAIEHEATPQELWEHRKDAEKQLSEEAKAARRIVKAAERYLEVTAPENGFAERRKACTNLIEVFTLEAKG